MRNQNNDDYGLSVYDVFFEESPRRISLPARIKWSLIVSIIFMIISVVSLLWFHKGWLIDSPINSGTFLCVGTIFSIIGVYSVVITIAQLLLARKTINPEIAATVFMLLLSGGGVMVSIAIHFFIYFLTPR